MAIVLARSLTFARPSSIARTMKSFLFSLLVLSLLSLSAAAQHGDGSNHALEFQTSGDHALLNSVVNLSQRDFSIEFWTKRDQAGAGMIIGHGVTGAFSENLHIGFRKDNRFTFGFYGDDLDADGSFSELDWHHWACTFDSKKRSRKIYRDGILVGSDVSEKDYSGAGSLYIGRATWGHESLIGKVDEVRIWGRVLSANEIKTNMNQRLKGDEKGLETYYSFDEGDGFKTADKAGKNDALIRGSKWVASGLELGESAPQSTLLFQGTQGGEEIQLELTFKGNEIEGQYFFGRDKAGVIVVGHIDPKGHIVLIEQNAAGEHLGMIMGATVRPGSKIRGSWFNVSGSDRVEFIVSPLTR